MNGILRLSVENLLRVKTAEVTPDGSLVIVGGRNDQGKTSLLNSIALALSGKDVPAQPIRKGATIGQVILQTAELTVTRRFTAAGPTLEVRDADGAKILSPQAKLDTLLSRVTFDPLEFTRQEPAKQLETLKRIVGLDFTALDVEYGRAYEKRTTIGRSVRDKESQLRNIIRTPEAPAEEVSVEELTQELEKAQEFNRANADKREALSERNDDVDKVTDRVEAAKVRVHQAQQALSEAQKHLTAEQDLLGAEIVSRDKQKEVVAALADVDTAPIIARLKSADATNAAVRANALWNSEHKALIALQDESKKLTDALEAIEKKKAEELEKAKFPVEGLGFGDAGVLYKDVPFEQAGTAVKIRTSVAIARALAPQLPVMLVRDGSLLDEESLALLKQEADKAGLQIWMEVVGNREDATVIIEDGQVADRPAARKKATSKPK